MMRCEKQFFQHQKVQFIKMRSVGIAYLLWFLGGFGVLGIHRFYAGRVGTGILWFFTGGLFGFGALIDLFLIPGMIASANRGN